jgi:DNA-binding NarL/FixJ family response regulator
MPASAAPLRVAIAEDEALFRNALAALLNSAGVNVTATCESADELMPRIRQETPDIVILDIQMPPTRTDEGIQAAALIRQEFPDVGILVLSMYAEPAYASAVMAIGKTSIGYLLKQRVTSTDSLLKALERIANKEWVVDPGIVQALLDRPKRKPLIDKLSPREREVLQLMAEGYSNSRIGVELQLVKRTIESYIGDIFDKLELSKDDQNTDRRVQAVITWLRGM